MCIVHRFAVLRMKFAPLLLVLLAVPLPAMAAGVLRVGVLDDSPPCSQQQARVSGKDVRWISGS
jgi:hypothetical protein